MSNFLCAEINSHVNYIGSYPRSYYESAISSGRILISGKQVTCEYKIQGGDELTHTVHRHEPAVALSDSTKIDTTLREPPPIDIIHEDESILVVDKPSNLPIHPCGAYHYNSLFEILSHWKPTCYGPGKLYTIYRLDRLTSGVVLLAKNASMAASLSKCIAEREGCEKIYVARVKGHFPFNLSSSADGKDAGSWEFKYDGSDTNCAISPPCEQGEYSSDHMKHWRGGFSVPLKTGRSNDNKYCESSCAALGYWFTCERGCVATSISLHDYCDEHSRASASVILDVATCNNYRSSNERQDTPIYWLHFACPCRISCHKDGICEAGDFSHLTDEKERRGIKHAQTSFTLLTYDAALNTSVVLAKPVTGRTHQIRLHLQQLGHPIANDLCYGGELPSVDRESNDACEKAKQWLNELDPKDSSTASYSVLSNVPATDEEVRDTGVRRRRRDDDESMLDLIEETCVWCARCRGPAAGADTKINLREKVLNRTLMEYFVRSQGIWLHALQYSLILNDMNTKENKMTYRTKLPMWTRISQD